MFAKIVKVSEKEHKEFVKVRIVTEDCGVLLTENTILETIYDKLPETFTMDELENLIAKLGIIQRRPNIAAKIVAEYFVYKKLAKVEGDKLVKT